MCPLIMATMGGRGVTDPLILRAHIAEIEEMRDDLLAHAKMGQIQAQEMVVKLHKVVMEKRDRLRGTPRNLH